MVPAQWLNAVFFLGVERPVPRGQPRVEYVGTGFYVRVVNEFDPSLSRLYFVTARHVVEGSRGEAGRLFLRFNLMEGGSYLHEISKFAWRFHDDPTIDVAVHAPTFKAPQREAPTLEHMYVEADTFATPERLEEHRIGLGTRIAIIGLFNRREGAERNIPIVRSGSIAAMPGEPIDDGGGHGPYRGYLAETLSIGGLSGSPVYALPEPEHRHPISSPRLGVVAVGATTVKQTILVLGMVRSHWDEQPPTARGKQVPRSEWINRGIAAVTPIEDVLKVLNYRVFKEQRRRQAAKRRLSHVVAPGG